MRQIHLGVNIDHVATLRQARGTRYPDPVHAAAMAEQAGADSITVHLREDRRHIQERDVRLLKETLQTRMNLEMAVTEEMLGLALDLRPADCCLVPERREELTTEGGLDLGGDIEGRVRQACTRLVAAGIRVSLFVDPEPAQVDLAADTGAPVIELHTGGYAEAQSSEARARELERLRTAAARAAGHGLVVHAGHGLNYHNVQPVVRIPEIVELNIGHAIVAEAVFAGLGSAVDRMKMLIRQAQ